MPLIALNVETGEERTYDSTTDAAKDLRFTTGRVSNARRTGKEYGGWLFQLAEPQQQTRSDGVQRPTNKPEAPQKTRAKKLQRPGLWVPLIARNPKTGEERSYKSTTEAAQAFGVAPASVSAARRLRHLLRGCTYEMADTKNRPARGSDRKARPPQAPLLRHEKRPVAHLRRLVPPDSPEVPVIATNLVTGEEKFYGSITKAARELGLTIGRVASACREGRPTANWEFVKANPNQEHNAFHKPYLTATLPDGTKRLYQSIPHAASATGVPYEKLRWALERGRELGVTILFEPATERDMSSLRFEPDHRPAGGRAEAYRPSSPKRRR